MLLAAIAALAIANSGIYGQFEHLIHTQIGFVVGDSISTMSIAHIINDILMAVFFLLVGLEIKYEMTVGELTNIRQAICPSLRHAAACSRLLLFMRFSISKARNAWWLGRSHRDRHRFRAWHYGAFGQSHSCWREGVPLHACRGR